VARHRKIRKRIEATGQCNVTIKYQGHCCSWTDNHRSVWFIFGSESSSPSRFLGIIHSFKVTRKRLKCLKNAFPAIKFSNFSKGGAPRYPAQGFAPSALAGDRLRLPPLHGLQPSLVRKACLCPSNRFHPVRLCIRKYLCNSCFIWVECVSTPKIATRFFSRQS